MKKGRKFYENENLIIYVGTAIFFILAISVGIVMYMTTKANSKVGNETGKSTTENIENVEDASSNMGKTVEEQEKIAEQKNDEISNRTESTTTEIIENTTNTEKDENKADSEKKENTVKTETTANATENTQVTEEKKPLTFTKPTDGEIIAEFAQENLIYSDTLKEWITHTGIDIKADKTSVIKASADGVVTSILNDPRYGLTVVISHDEGYETIYSNLLTAEFVVEGEEVKQGQTIGTAGNTASFESGMESHLHFEIMQDGKYLNPKIDIDIILCYNANVYIVYHSYTFRLLNNKFSESYYETFRAN